MRPINKTIKSILMLIFAILLGLMIVLTILIWVYSPGKMKPFPDESGNPLVGSISEKSFVNINGLEQGMIIKSKNKNYPVLLYLHGGVPDYFLTNKYPTGLENYFTVVWWERRGSGLSFNADDSPAAITLQQLLSDTKEVTNYLRSRFGKEKIYLMGRSGGTYLGIQAAAQTPELYHAYIAVAQMTDQLKSEMLASEYMIAQFTQKGNGNMVKKLKAAPVTRTEGTSAAYLALRDKAMHSLGIGTTHDMKSIVTGMFIPSLTCPEYTLMEKVNLWRAKSRSGVSVLWDDILNTDLATKVTELKMPVYFFHGIHDYTVSYPLAKAYLKRLKAPLKGFYSFKHSAHSPFFEEPMMVNQVMLEDVLNNTVSLADKEQ